jgi:hypothetical protein
MKVIADLPLGMFTAPGPQAVIAPVAERVFNCAQTLARDGSIGPKTGRTFVGYEQAPGLRCMITVVHFVDQGREGSLRPYIYLEWQQMPGYTEEGWSRFRQVPDGEWREKLAAYRTVNRITERVPMYIGLGAAAVHLPKQWKQALRRSEQWRFDPQKADPLASWMRNHLDPQIKADRAVLERRGNREPPTWGRMLYINPKKQTVNDAYFQLTLVLLQERILPETAALQAEMIAYLAQWADEATALMVFKALLRHFTEPDDWRALPAYCKTVARREAQQEQPGRVIGGSARETRRRQYR